MSYSEIISAGVSSIEFRGPNEGPVGTNFTQSLSGTPAPTITNISPSVGIQTTTLTITGTNFISGSSTVTLEGDATASNTVLGSTSMTCVVNNDYVDGTQKDVTVANNLVTSASTSVTDENYHDTITITFTVETAAASDVIISSSASNTITPTWSSPTLTISGTTHADITEHLQNIVIATTSYSSSFTVAVSSSDGTATGTTGTLTCTPGYATTTNGYKQNTPPVWSTAAGSLGTFDEYSTVSITLSATDADSHGVTYTLQGGSSLPGGLSLGSAGVISGEPTNVGTTTTTSFTVVATDSLGESVTRTFSISIDDAPMDWVYAAHPALLGTFSEGDTISIGPLGNDDVTGYTIASGTIPAGTSFNTSTGVISGTLSNLTSDVTSSFGVQGTDGVGSPINRTFSIVTQDLRYSTSVAATYTGADQLSASLSPGSHRALVAHDTTIIIGSPGTDYQSTTNEGAWVLMDATSPGTSTLQHDPQGNPGDWGAGDYMGSSVDYAGTMTVIGGGSEGVHAYSPSGTSLFDSPTVKPGGAGSNWGKQVALTYWDDSTTPTYFLTVLDDTYVYHYHKPAGGLNTYAWNLGATVPGSATPKNVSAVSDKGNATYGANPAKAVVLDDGSVDIWEVTRVSTTLPYSYTYAVTNIVDGSNIFDDAVIDGHYMAALQTDTSGSAVIKIYKDSSGWVLDDTITIATSTMLEHIDMTASVPASSVDMTAPLPRIVVTDGTTVYIIERDQYTLATTGGWEVVQTLTATATTVAITTTSDGGTDYGGTNLIVGNSAADSIYIYDEE
jgi:hypothetical protein